jgi:carbamoyltransferase
MAREVVLGISSSHDSSACVFVDGELVSAVSEERLSRIKCDGSRLPQLAIDRCLAEAGFSRKDVTHIATTYAHFPERYCEPLPWPKS